MPQGENKNRVQVRIYGEEYTMKSDAAPEYMKRVAQYVDEKMRQIGHNSNRFGLNKLAVLTAVNMADELFRVRKELRDLEELLDKSTTTK
ncbi:MAG: cell division protein ZapA [Dethiobacter sp.]|nr:cell division protein ZapA [Dethiobacter sp.]MCL5982598.1 cell division protein ZapA [Bacillota bacterium]